MQDKLLRKLNIIGTPLVLGILDLSHPAHYHPTGVFQALAPHIDWWLTIHIIQLFLFGLLGVGIWSLVDGLKGPAATICKLSTVAFVIFYNAFDALVGLGTGTLVKYAAGLGPELQPQAVATVDVFWGSIAVAIVTAIAVLSWMVAVISAAIARSEATVGHWPMALLGTLTVFFGWLGFPLGIVGTVGWWAGVVGAGLAFALAAKPRLPMALLAVGAILFATSHTPPYGPSGMLLYLLAVLQLELLRHSRSQAPATRARVS